MSTRLLDASIEARLAEQMRVPVDTRTVADVVRATLELARDVTSAECATAIELTRSGTRPRRDCCGMDPVVLEGIELAEPDRHALADAGFADVLVLPIGQGDRCAGRFAWFSHRDATFDEQDGDAAAQFAADVWSLLTNALLYWEARELSEHLRTAMLSRAHIEQAKGIIMATARVTADDAFALLRQQSQHENLKLRDVAVAIVATYERRAE